VREAARAINVSEKTLWTWQALPHFKAAYEMQRQALIEEVRGGFSALASKAISGISQLMDDPETPAAVKLKAYLAVLDRIVPAEPQEERKPVGFVSTELLGYLDREELDLVHQILERAEQRAVSQSAQATI
jgi:hypothetical protein